MPGTSLLSDHPRPLSRWRTAASSFVAFALAAFVGAAVYSVGTFALAFNFASTPIDALLVLPLMVVVMAVASLPVAAPLCAIAWLFRHEIRKLPSPVAMTVLGALFGSVIYLVWVYLGMGQDSSRPMTFTENLFRWVHAKGLLLAIVGGIVASRIYRRAQGN